MLNEAIYFNLITVWILTAVVALPINLFIVAPCGMHTNKTWRPLISNRLGWILMELLALLAFSVLFLIGSGEKTIVGWLFFCLWILHYFNRTIIFPFRQRKAIFPGVL